MSVLVTPPIREISILKANGEREVFNPMKLENSLIHAGATPEVVQKIVAHISREIEDGTSTTDIYSHARFLLNKFAQPSAARYSLRRAIADLGPSGFPFEKFVAEVFHAQGYTILTDQTVKGHCAEHEVDVVAYKDDKLVMSEIKFHNQTGLKTDLKVALYVKARFDDLRKVSFHYGGKSMHLSEGWLITNTKFTKSAIGYAMCAGVSIIGWNYPVKDNLHSLVNKYSLHPLTCLTTLTHDEKKYLLEKGIVLCKTLLDNPSILVTEGFTQKKVNLILEEIRLL